MGQFTNVALALSFGFALTSCSLFSSSDSDMEHGMEQDSEVTEMMSIQPVSVPSPMDGWSGYGEAIPNKAALAGLKGFAQVAADPSSYDGKTVMIMGEIEEICQSKGCWMNFTHEGESMRIKFQDYGFFVPMDATGEAIVQGTFAVTTTPLAEAQHYLEDAGRLEEAAALTEDVVGMTFMATSVLIKSE